MEYGIISISETPGPFEPKVGWGGGMVTPLSYLNLYNVFCHDRTN